MKPTPELERRASAVASMLYMQDYNRTFHPGICPDRELTLEEYVVLVVDRFRTNIYINGFDGFDGNTEGTYTHFLPIALAAIGANQFSRLARRAIEQKRRDEEGKSRLRTEFLHCKEDLHGLYFAYIDQHRDRLPNGDNLITEKEWEEQKQQWRGDLEAAWANKERACPRCATVFVSKSALGFCPKCNLSFTPTRA